jgi:Protein of unknown function (DUF1236)
MKEYRNILLTAAAAIAIAAGTGAAAAQQSPANGAVPHPSQHSKGTHAEGQRSPHSAGPHTAQTGQPGAPGAQVHRRNAQSNAAGEGAQHNGGQKPEHNASGGGGMQHNAQGNESSGAAGRGNLNPKPSSASNGTNPSGKTQRTVQASGSSVHLSEHQRIEIRQRIIESHRAPRAGHVQFNVNVGTVIPRRNFHAIHVVAVPHYLVQIEPRWSGLDYFVFRDEIVIVNPRNLRIVAIVPA